VEPEVTGPDELTRWHELGERVRYYRALRGWTQGRLGRVLGWDSQAVSAVELGRAAVDPADLRPLADALGVTLARLAGEEPPR
jgi:transcriptional regulator with XRE-family HTH domain